MALRELQVPAELAPPVLGAAIGEFLESETD